MQIGSIYGLLPLACIISPFIGGQIADRYLNTEKFLGIAHLIGGVLMLFMAIQKEFGRTLWIDVSLFAFLCAYIATNQLDYFPPSCLALNVSSDRSELSERFGWIAAGHGIDIFRRILGRNPSR